MKRNNFLTVYTASATIKAQNWPVDHLILGSYVCRGDAIRECAEYAMNELEVNRQALDVAYENETLTTALKGIGMSDDEIDELFGVHDANWKIPPGPRKAMLSAVDDELGGDGCFIIGSRGGSCEYRFDVDETDVEGRGGLRLYTCITSGKDAECHDPEWEQPFPEVFLSADDAAACALNDLELCLEGRDREVKKAIRMEARKALADDGFYEYCIDGRKSRHWGIWSTPLDLGDGAPKIQRA